MDNPDWINALTAAAAGIVGGILSGGAYRDFRDYLARPKLTLDFDTTGGRVEVNARQKDNSVVSEIYIRVRLRNAGKRIATNCVVFLTAITEVQPSGTIPTSFHDAMPLAWPGWEFSPRQIPPGIDVYVDLLRVTKAVSGWLISVKQLLASQSGLCSYRGTYRFYLIAVADNAEPKKFEIDVT